MKEQPSKDILRISETDLFDEAGARSRINDGWQTLNRLLRGKYKWLLILAPLMAILGGLYGWKQGQRSYASTGIVRVIPILPRVMANDDEHGPMPMFDSFAETQAALVQSRPVIDAALKMPVWTRLHGPATDADSVAFLRNLVVERKQELIYIKYSDTNPEVAVAGTTALVTEYEKLNAELDARSDEKRIGMLREMRQAVGQQLLDVQTQIVHLADNAGTDNLTALYESKLSYMRGLDSKLQDVQLELSQYGDVGLRSKTLRERADALALIREQTRNELSIIGKQNSKMIELNRDADALRAQSDEIRQRIDRLSVESRASSRVEIVSTFEKPVSPEKDSRVTRAAMGMMGGATGVFAVLLLMGIIDSRIRLPDDLPGRLREAPMLGMLPRLPKNSENPIRAAAAAHCVQHIRTMVQLWCGARDKKVLTVSSSVSGSGKTTLTMALGVSCAASGCRTLLIDCDLVGAELTRSFRATVRRKLGAMLLRESLITEQQLRVALDRAQQYHLHLGETLIQGGIVSEKDVERLLADQQRQEVGLLDTLGGDPLEECIATTTVDGLDVLPVGSATAGHAATLSQVGLKRLLTTARKRYDMILIDTGPMPGSIEGAVATSVSDGVILTVTSGERRAMLSRTLDHLNKLSCEVVGVVFNRVRRAEEVVLSSSHRSTRLVESNGSDLMRIDQARIRSTAHFGPIERAVMCSVPDNQYSDSFSNRG